MHRHAFAWESFTFGMFFLAIVGNRFDQKQDAFTLEQLSIAATIALIALGAIGIFWRKQ